MVIASGARANAFPHDLPVLELQKADRTILVLQRRKQIWSSEMSEPGLGFRCRPLHASLLAPRGWALPQRVGKGGSSRRQEDSWALQAVASSGPVSPATSRSSGCGEGPLCSNYGLGRETDSASSWIHINERRKHHTGRSEAKDVRGWALGSGKGRGWEAEVRVGESGSLALGTCPRSPEHDSNPETPKPVLTAMPGASSLPVTHSLVSVGWG